MKRRHSPDSASAPSVSATARTMKSTRVSAAKSRHQSTRPTFSWHGALHDSRGGARSAARAVCTYSAEAEREVLEAALARRPGGLPLLVANPDTVRPDGKDTPMPGMLASRYRAMGATDIRLVGKPHALIYEACRQKLVAEAGISPDEARIVAVGDSLHHDVLGAANNGVDSIFICSGVHYTDLGIPQAQDVAPDPEKLQALLDEFAAETDGVEPTHTLTSFRL